GGGVGAAEQGDEFLVLVRRQRRLLGAPAAGVRLADDEAGGERLDQPLVARVVEAVEEQDGQRHLVSGVERRRVLADERRGADDAGIVGGHAALEQRQRRQRGV